MGGADGHQRAMNTLLADFVERVTRAARNVSVSFARREDLESREFRGGKGEPALQAALLPDEVVGAILGRTPVLFATLPDTYDSQVVAGSFTRPAPVFTM